MNGAALDRVFRTAGGRIVAALAARFRDLGLAEDAFAEACLRAARNWPERGVPGDPAAWLFRVAEHAALDALRQKRVREHTLPEPPEPAPHPEELLADDARVIPDERLRLIFICCHPAVALDARAALTLRLVCGLSTTEIARAFLVQEATLAQRLVRAKRKIAEAGVAFELPAPEHWPERLQAVLSTIEVAYAKAHEDAAGRSPHAAFAAEMLHLSRLLVELLPTSGEVRALAALLHYAEARRPARIDSEGVMVPLAEQDPRLWRRDLIAEVDRLLIGADRLAPDCPRLVQALLQRSWCARRTLEEPPPWQEALALYDLLLQARDDPIVHVNRAVALAEIDGPAAALRELDELAAAPLQDFLPYQAVRADLLARTGDVTAALAAYSKALALNPGQAERRWLKRKAAKSRGACR